MNVFTGLAVGDVATVMSEAEQVKARYQMKLVANYRTHPLLKNRIHNPELDLNIVNAEEYGFFRKMKNIIQKHYIIGSTSFLMRKSKIARWLAEREKFSGNGAALKDTNQGYGDIMNEKMEILTKEISSLKENMSQMQLDMTKILALLTK